MFRGAKEGPHREGVGIDRQQGPFLERDRDPRVGRYRFPVKDDPVSESGR